jgi:hypothetical protein
MKPRHLLLGVALAASAALAIFGEGAAAPELAEAVERAPARRPSSSLPLPSSPPARPQAPDVRILALAPRDALVGDGADGPDDAGAFARRDWTPPPPPPAQAPPAPPPTAPPLPFTVIGKSVEGGTWEVYLAQGDRLHVVRDGAVIDGTYRVDAIAPPVLTLTYLPLNQAQQLTIGAFD